MLGAWRKLDYFIPDPLAKSIDVPIVNRIFADSNDIAGRISVVDGKLINSGQLSQVNGTVRRETPMWA